MTPLQLLRDPQLTPAERRQVIARLSPNELTVAFEQDLLTVEEVHTAQQAPVTS